MVPVHLQRTYFRGFFFDHALVVGVPLIAALVTLSVAVGWVDFRVMLAADLYLLGYHHVISTYSRISFEPHTTEQNRRLLVYLPLIIVLSVLVLANTFGAWMITTIYLHWQWFHYVRQSEGIAKGYSRKTASAEQGSPLFNRVLFYLTPVTSFLAMSSRQPETFLFAKVATLPVPIQLVGALAVLNIAGLLWWFYQQLQSFRHRKLAGLHFGYLVSHHAIFFVAYVIVKDINLGWLGINTWHNLQYILFVWIWHSNKYRNGHDPQKPVLSWLSQGHRFGHYFVAFAVLAFVFYETINGILASIFSAEMFPIAILIAYQSINFHHYILDSLIWKLRQKSVRDSLGIAA